MPASLRSGSVALFAFAAFGIALAQAPLPAGPGPSRQQQAVLELTNQDRVLQGLQPLAWNPALARAAQQQAMAMANAGVLSHRLPGEPNVAARAAAAGAHFDRIAENIAFGHDPKQIEREWMHSVPHRANILDPGMNSIGIGIYAAGGLLWAVEDFSAAVAAADPAQTEAIVSQELARRGLAIAAPGSPQATAARAACPQFEGDAGAHARFVVRWESPSLQTLPGPLSDAIASGQYTQAAVGACPATNPRNADFTVHRVAVLLF